MRVDSIGANVMHCTDQGGVVPTCLIGSVMAGPWSQPRLQRIMVPKVDQTENPPPAHTSASDVLSGVHLYKQ